MMRWTARSRHCRSDAKSAWRSSPDSINRCWRGLPRHTSSRPLQAGPDSLHGSGDDWCFSRRFRLASAWRAGINKSGRWLGHYCLRRNHPAGGTDWTTKHKHLVPITDAALLRLRRRVQLCFHWRRIMIQVGVPARRAATTTISATPAR